MPKAGKKFLVDTSPTKEVVVNSLTKDATVKACIFDLVDNSIDAARETLFRNMPVASRPRLPDSYEGFKIDLKLNADGLKISDNCGGIPVETLKTMVLRFGKRSAHTLGIGVFGVGLNRALFKLGQVSHLKTDTGLQRAELVLTNKDYLKAKGWNLPAEEFKTSGEVGTEIEIGRPAVDVAQQFADQKWCFDLRREMGRRFARFIAKKLIIKVNGIAVADEEVPLREDGPYDGEHKFYKSEEDVFIIVQYGQHRDHRFKKESGYDKKRNAGITDQFGWNVLCNDRAIKIADRSDKVGWDTKFHTEFYGFVGYASFVGDPAHLPWNTTKTDVDLNNHAYRMALTDMRKFAEKWRTIAEQRKSAPSPRQIPPKRPKDPASPPPTSGSQVKSGPTKKGPLSVPITKPDHTDYRTVLPADLVETHCVDKHLKVIHEAKELDIGDSHYTGLALIRMLFEFSVAAHLQRHKKFAELKQFAIDRRRDRGMKITTEDERNVWPRFDEIVPYLDQNPSIWGDNQAQLKHIVKKLKPYQQTLNSTLHNPFQQIGSPTAFEIRDEMMPLLRHLIET